MTHHPIFQKFLFLATILTVLSLVPDVHGWCRQDWDNRCKRHEDCCSRDCWRGAANWEFGVCRPGGGNHGGGGGGNQGGHSNGKTTRYWDCCKPSCSWHGKAQVSNPVATCARDGRSVLGINEQSGCGDGGTAFTCSNNQPWAVNDNLAYGFAAAHVRGQGERDWCCACYELTFTSGPVNGKKMIVQVTNTGGDLGENHFDLQIPGGGVGIFNGCSRQWNAPNEGWGARYGGVHSAHECNQLPWQLQAGCHWRFEWFRGADNPNIRFQKVSCPAELTQKSNCVRT